jgi:hypothetical protein
MPYRSCLIPGYKALWWRRLRERSMIGAAVVFQKSRWHPDKLWQQIWMGISNVTLPPGEYDIEVNYIGYESLSDAVQWWSMPIPGRKW